MKQKLFALMTLVALALNVHAQDVSKIQFCDKKYEYGTGKDSVTLFLKVLDSKGKSCNDVTASQLEKYLVINEDGIAIPLDRRT